MKPFSYQNFKDYHGLFRWSSPDITQSFWTKDETYYDYETRNNIPITYTLSTIRYRGDRVLQFYTNDPTNRNSRLVVYNVHKDTSLAHELVTNNSWKINANTIIDTLYYKANPPKYYNNNGTLKKGFWGILKRRLHSPTYRPSWVTQHMLTEATTMLTREYNESTANDLRPSLTTFISMFLSECNIDDYTYYKDALTNKYYVEGTSQTIKIAGGYCKVHKSTDPTQHGYRHDNDNNIWLLPNEFFHEGQVYDRTEVNIVECTQCHTETVSDLTVDGVCHKCLDASFKIHNYSTRVEGMLKFKATKVKPSTVYLGCELEYETNNRSRAQMGVGKLMHGHALMKSDGSIQNGFEIVTCPATLDIHLEVFKKFYDNIPPDLKIQNNVGMHVHISRKPLSQLTIGKLTEFLNRDENKDFIHHIAGRINNQYARMDKTRSVTYPWRYKHGGDRYNALNLNNPNTVEIRLFATPMDYKTFAMRLQFCQALVDYCGPASTSLPLKQQTLYKSFMGWLNTGNRKLYPELSTHLKGFN